MNGPTTPARTDAGDGPEAPAGAADAFKDAMRHLAGGVCIITAAHGRERSGLTVTSLVSLSAEPPSVIVSINRNASTLPLLRRSGRFAASLLGQGHSDIADRFAGRAGVRGAARFAGAEWIGRPDHPPVLADALASFECEVAETMDRFSHTIVIGLVTASRTRSESGGALVYWRAAYDQLGRLKS